MRRHFGYSPRRRLSKCAPMLLRKMTTRSFITTPPTGAPPLPRATAATAPSKPKATAASQTTSISLSRPHPPRRARPLVASLFTPMWLRPRCARAEPPAPPGGGERHAGGPASPSRSSPRYDSVSKASAPENGAGATRPERVRVMFLISDTGGGHRASAKAMSAAFNELYPGRVEALIVDFWTEIVGQPFRYFPEGYSFLAKNPALWRAAWQYGRFPLTRRLTEEFSNAVGNQNFRRALAEFRPHLVVSVHPLTQFIPLRVLRSLATALPFVTVCTDLGGAHPTWFHRDADLCFVPTERVRKIAMCCGLKVGQLRQYGLPVRADFWHDATEKTAMRTQLSLQTQLPPVLVVGGGVGVGGVERVAVSIAEAMGRKLGAHGAQLVVVCGKNERLKKRLSRRSWPVSVQVEGFVENMSEWMAASDLIVSKAGPGTIAEALIRGLPIVLSGFLPGQEAPNVEYVTESGVGTFSRDPEMIAQIVTEWLSQPRMLAERSKRAKALGRPNATHQIVREMGKLVELEGCSSPPGVVAGGVV